MKYVYSKSSLMHRSTLHPDLICLVDNIIKYYDCTIICGYRDKEDQDKEYAKGNSRVKWPNSKHNTCPSIAVDIMMYPIKWKDTVRNAYFGGFVMGIAKKLKEEGKMCHSIIWGRNWDDDSDFHDQSLNDFPHFHLAI